MNGMLILLGLLFLMTMGRPRTDPRIGDPGTGGWEADD